jgi:hypothetical protein
MPITQTIAGASARGFGGLRTFGGGSPATVELMMIGGGGPSSTGGSSGVGGGGAGGLVYVATQSVALGVQYTATVGAGGAGPVNTEASGTKGTNSTFTGSGISVTAALAGGVGYSSWNTGTAPSSSNGGCGGGGGGREAGQQDNPAGIGSQGGNGGIGSGQNNLGRSGGGGGGISNNGQNAAASDPGNGGDGTSVYSDWAQAVSIGQLSGGLYYLGGGGGGAMPDNGTQGAGGLGGGGIGAGGNTPLVGGPGQANTGSGGGAATRSPESGSWQAGNGGSGVIILRYPSAFLAATSTTGSPTVAVNGGYRYYAFKADGSITF